MDNRSERTAAWLVLSAFVAQLLTLLLLPDGNRGWLYRTFTFLRDTGKCGYDGPPLYLLGLSGAVLSGGLAITGYRKTANRWMRSIAIVAFVLALLLAVGWLLSWISRGCDV